MDREYIDIATLLGLALALATVYENDLPLFFKIVLPVASLILLMMSLSILIVKIKNFNK